MLLRQGAAWALDVPARAGDGARIMSRLPPVGPLKLGWMGGVAGYLYARNMAFKHAPNVSNAMMRLTNVSGRGRGRDGLAAAAYFEGVASDYEVIAREAGVLREGASVFAGRRVLELGPGNTQAIALLAKTKGARAFAGWDAFDVLSRDEAYLSRIYAPLLERAGSSPSRARELLEECKIHASRAALERVGPFDLVVSRAVLEHVRDLDALHRDLAALTTSDAVLIHKVDLRSHGFEWDHELDFLLFTERAWKGLTSHVGEPNRARFPAYLELARRHGFAPIYVASSRVISPARVERVRSRLASPFREMPASVLGVLGFWIVLVRQGHPLASRATFPSELPAAPHDALATF